MKKIIEIHYLDTEENNEYNSIIENVVKQCFKEEKLEEKNIYVNIILTNPENIRNINNTYRNIDSQTDVLSFPMFEKEEIKKLSSPIEEVLGDIVVSIQRVQEQAEEYGHSFKRELSYMIVHGFYHLIGYDHMVEEDKIQMRKKEENILNQLKIGR